MKTTLNAARLQTILERLTQPNTDLARRYPGEATTRQPVHTVYGGAHLFKADTVAKLGELARAAFAEYAPDPATFARGLGLFEASAGDTLRRDAASEERLAALVHARVGEKLRREPVEDFRLDFEDGFGIRPDAEEDDVAAAAARETAKGLAAGTLPPFIGIRVKTLSEELKARAVRTLDIYLSTLLAETGGKLPPGFVVTLPKVTTPAQVEAFVQVLALAEQGLGLKAGSLKMEIMVEVTQAILDESGRSPLPLMAKAGLGRVIGAHFGTYDYTASCSITAAYQSMDHPACDFARHMMKVAFAGQEINLSDGATNVMPVGPHRGKDLTAEQRRENTDVVHRAWALSYRHVRHSLRNAFYQGWDLHPAQLPVRYGAAYAFFLEGVDAATARLKAFMDKAAQATLVGDVFDDAATGQGLLNYFIRALACGAVTEDEVLATGLTLDEIRSRSFLKILEGRKRKAR